MVVVIGHGTIGNGFAPEQAMINLVPVWLGE
jgi:hypothetical protein